MSSIDDLVRQIPISQLAGQLGVSEAEAEQAVRAALPALVGGMEANAKDPAGAASLQRAIGQHDGGLLEGGIDLDQVDTDDGAKIVRNVFGDHEGAVVNQLGGIGGLDPGLIAKLLPMLAPLLMSFLGTTLGGGGGDAKGAGSSSTSGMGPGSGRAASGEDDGGGGGGLGDLLGGLLGGGGSGGGGLGGLLGGGGLGDVLGGLLGGGKK